MKTTKAFGKADMSFLKKVGINSDIPTAETITKIREFLGLTPPLVPVRVKTTTAPRIK